MPVASETRLYFVRFEVFTLVLVKVQILWYLLPCRKVNVNQYIKNAVTIYQQTGRNSLKDIS